MTSKEALEKINEFCDDYIMTGNSDVVIKDEYFEQLADDLELLELIITKIIDVGDLVFNGCEKYNAKQDLDSYKLTLREYDMIVKKIFKSLRNKKGD